ncbi:MAG: DoxX family protein [Cyclobacteriaceae bacterium]|nr:DoxX family protein [Cyclobacteriaceae bacterium]
MTWRLIFTLLSSISFFIYGISYFYSPTLKSEFKRFGLEKFGGLTAILEILGAIGLLVGFVSTPILLISSAGLAALMLLGVIVRARVKDSLWVSLPAILFMVVNAYIFYDALGF